MPIWWIPRAFTAEKHKRGGHCCARPAIYDKKRPRLLYGGGSETRINQMKGLRRRLPRRSIYSIPAPRGAF